MLPRRSRHGPLHHQVVTNGIERCPHCRSQLSSRPESPIWYAHCVAGRAADIHRSELDVGHIIPIQARRMMPITNRSIVKLHRGNQVRGRHDIVRYVLPMDFRGRKREQRGNNEHFRDVNRRHHQLIPGLACPMTKNLQKSQSACPNLVVNMPRSGLANFFTSCPWMPSTNPGQILPRAL